MSGTSAKIFGGGIGRAAVHLGHDEHGPDADGIVNYDFWRRAVDDAVPGIRSS